LKKRAKALQLVAANVIENGGSDWSSDNVSDILRPTNIKPHKNVYIEANDINKPHKKRKVYFDFFS